MINTINVLYNQQDNIMSYKNNADILTWKRVIENLQKKTDETVTEYNKAQQSRQSKNIKEGTWAIPETPEQVIKLKNLLKNPLDAATALNELGDVFGDDELFDTLEDMKENEPDTDVRHVVISRLKEMNFIKEVREGYKVLPPMDSKYVERDGLEGPFTTLSGKVVYYDPKEGKYYDPDTDMYMSYDEWNAHNSDQSGMTEWVQEPHEGQKWTGQEKNFIHDLCKRHDGIQMQWPKPQTGADGIKGPSPLWDEGKIMSNDADLQKLLSWVEKNKHDVESYFKSDFRVYSNKDKGQSQSDGNQVLDNIRAKIGSVEESKQLDEVVFLAPWILPAVATAIRFGGPPALAALRLLLKGGSKAAPKIVKTGGNLVQKSTGTGLVVGAVGKTIYDNAKDAYDGIKNWFKLDMDEDTIKVLAQLVVKYGIPLGGIAAVLYGGKQLKDYMSGEEEEEKGNTTINNYYNKSDEPVAEASVLAHGGKGQYKAVTDGGVVRIMHKGKEIASGDFDSGADGWFVSRDSDKGQKFFGNAQDMVDHFAENIHAKTNEEKEELKEFWPAVAYAASRIPPSTYASVGTAVGAAASKAGKWVKSKLKSSVDPKLKEDYANEQHEQLEYIHHVLQECGDGNMDITMVEQAIEYVEDIREQHFDDEGDTKSESVNEESVNEHEMSLLGKVARQMEADAHSGDYTAIEELLHNVTEDEMEAFLSDHRSDDFDEGVMGTIGQGIDNAVVGTAKLIKKGVKAASPHVKKAAKDGVKKMSKLGSKNTSHDMKTGKTNTTYGMANATEAYNEDDKSDLDKMQGSYKHNEDRNAHSENILMLAHAFGSRPEIKAVEGLIKVIRRQGHTTPEQSAMMYNAIHKKYYGQLFPAENEGNAFSGELAKAKIDGKKEFDVDGKTYKVKEALSILIDKQKMK